MAALDAQSNWNVEMPQRFKVPIRPVKESSAHNPKPVSSSIQRQALIVPTSRREIPLPSEIISLILSFIPLRRDTQSTFWASSLVCRKWYHCSISLLYARPYLHGGNFNEFVTTVCPSKNANIRKSALSVLVRRLDMGDLVHNASKSLTARLLGRLKGNIEEFVAPQASFAINSFAALSKCAHLRHLDLSLISASISNKLLFQTLKSLQNLETLFFPRTTSHDQDYASTPYTWPSKLKALHLAGGIDHHFLTTHILTIPPTLKTLSIQHCSQVHASSLHTMLTTLGPQLTHLTIRHPMPQLTLSDLDTLLLSCPLLLALRISADYISNNLFTLIPQSHPLRILDLECSPTADSDVAISPSIIYDAVEDGKFPDLRSVRASARLAWAATKKSIQNASDLLEIMEENEMEKPVGMVAEVWYSTPD